MISQLIKIPSSTDEVFDLGENAVHVWSIQVDDASLCLECCRELLSAAERERAAKFRFETDHKRYIVAHAGLRSVLAAYLHGAKPLDLEFTRGPNDKPHLSATPAKPVVEFNLSHSHGAALIAVTRNSEVGVDIEHIREDFAFAEVAERFFTSREVAALRALPSPLQREAFYKCWTSKEALLKAKGTGLSGLLDEVEVVLTPEGAVRIEGGVPSWSLVELTAGDGYAAALAVEGAVREVRIHRWGGLTTECAHRRSAR